MEHIDLDSITHVSRTGNTIYFTDGKNKYRFMESKSTILMDFDLSDPLDSASVKIIDDAMTSIVELYESKFGKMIFENDNEYDEVEFSEYLPINIYLEDSVILPLFSYKKVDNKKIRFVPEKSGLNQWNASGRARDPREIYIPIPKYIHKSHPGFFPPRTESFILEIPGGKKLNVKLCQSEDKALMSNPNKALGEWLLNRVFEQPMNKLITYEDMERIRVNAVRVSKLKNGQYYINFIYIPEGYEYGKMTQLSSNR